MKFTELPLPGMPERFGLTITTREIAVGVFRVDDGGFGTARAMAELLRELPFERLIARYESVDGDEIDRDAYLSGRQITPDGDGVQVFEPGALFAHRATRGDVDPVFDVVHGPTLDDCREWRGPITDGPVDENDPENWYDVAVDGIDDGTGIVNDVAYDYLGPYASAADKLRHVEGLAREQGWLVPFEPADDEQRAQIAVARAAGRVELVLARVFGRGRLDVLPNVPVVPWTDPFGELSIRLADASGRRKRSRDLLAEVLVALPKVAQKRDRARLMKALGIDGILPDPWTPYAKPLLRSAPLEECESCGWTGRTTGEPVCPDCGEHATTPIEQG